MSFLKSKSITITSLSLIFTNYLFTRSIQNSCTSKYDSRRVTIVALFENHSTLIRKNFKLIHAQSSRYYFIIVEHDRLFVRLIID